MKCPHCGQDHPNQASICPATGNQILSFECPRCGEALAAGSVICSNCGLNLAEPSPGSPQVPGRPPPRLWLWGILFMVGLALLITGLYLIIRVFTSAQDEITRRTPLPTLDRTAIATYFVIPTETPPPPTATLTRAPTLTTGPTLTPTILSAPVTTSTPEETPEKTPD